MADTASDGEEEDAVPLTLRDCRPGLWVEVRTPKAHITWRGMISSVDPERKAPVRVKWLGECKGKAWPSDMPNHLFIWKGGEHDIHIESIHNVSDDLFHAARRYRMPTGDLPLKEDTGFYCLSYECQGRCSNSVAPNHYKVPGEEPKAPPKAPKISTKVIKPAKRKHEETKPQNCYVWEPNITADCMPCNTHSPFTYIRSRVFSDHDGPEKYITEPRHVGECHCMFRVRRQLTKLIGPVKVRHSEKTCAYRSLQAGSVNFPLHIVADDGGKGNGIRSKGFIPKGQLVMEYVGEIITSDEAARRETNYADRGLFYLHDIHGKIQKHTKEKFALDPTVFGNAARLFNHSCEPNVTTLEVHNERMEDDAVTCHAGLKDGDPGDSGWDGSDKLSNLPRVPRIGLFTMQDVQAGEMLSIDYSPGRTGNKLQKVTPCLCGLPKCKKWLF
jgi:histone-lysine N-methyltransferase SUV39H